MSLKPAGVAVVALLMLGAAPPDPLVRARTLYNQQQYDAAILAAREARRRADVADVAGVVLARAHLERYRSSADAADLAAARETLVTIDTGRLAPRDRHDLTVGYGELLYFDGRFGAAAEMFSSALGSGGASGAAGPSDRESVLDWWAIALDREAQLAASPERRRIYARVLDRMEPAAAAEPPSAVAMYWLAAAAAGADDPARAWHAAVAGWIRAPLAAGPRASLRADLERLVERVIIPTRAQLPAAGGDARRAAAAMHAEWESIKEIGIRR